MLLHSEHTQVQPGLFPKNSLFYFRNKSIGPAYGTAKTHDGFSLTPTQQKEIIIMKNTSFLSRVHSTCACFLIRKTGLLFGLAGLFVPGLAGAHPVDAAKPAATGYLQVFSSTEQSQWGEGSFYYLHTA